MRQNKIRGFTIIELLVVISIIGLLASVVLVAVNNTRQKGKIAKVAADFHQIQTQIDIIRDQQNKTMLQITGSGCSDCSFRDGLSVNSHAAALVILGNSWKNLGLKGSPLDPWGSPYLMDENEYEGGSSDCRYDQLFSAGPNTIDEVGGGDDITTDVTHWLCK